MSNYNAIKHSKNYISPYVLLSNKNIINYENNEIFLYNLLKSNEQYLRYFIPLFGYENNEFIIFIDCYIDIENNILQKYNDYRFVPLFNKNKYQIKKINKFFLMEILKKVYYNSRYYDIVYFDKKFISILGFIELKMDNLFEELKIELRKRHSAIKIQKCWRNCITNPKYKICKDRLLNEFQLISIV
jgi:hypothetical protein